MDLEQKSYYVVIFTSQISGIDKEGYSKMATEMESLAAQQPGYIGFESVREDNGFGISLSYWKDEKSIAGWKKVLAHSRAQEKGKSDWYQSYHIRVAKVEREYRFTKS